MDRANYKLFDENLVRNILITSGISLFEFMKKNKQADINEVCNFINDNSDIFIKETIENMKDMEEDFSDEMDSDEENDDQVW